MKILRSLPKLCVLILLLPVAIVFQQLGMDGVPLFVAAAIAILGTVTIIGKATEEIAAYTGPVWGGLLNATFGNVTELIIAMFALKAGIDAVDPATGERMFDVVRASITGSILGNLLLILGAAMLWGGLKHSVQKFSRVGAGVNIGMLWIVVIALVVPSLVAYLIPAFEGGVGVAVDEHLDAQTAEGLVRSVSIAAAVILLLLYGFSLVFSLRTHRFLLMPDRGQHDEAEWSKALAIGMLLGATLCVAYLSEAFVHSIEVMTAGGDFAMSDLFIGVVVVAIVGNAAEGSVAIWVARENKMELSYQIAMGSCLQVALLVAPVLVIASYFMGNLMTLTFNPFELMALGAAVMISSSTLNDGESTWLEGVMFVAVYIFFAMVFWFHP